MGCGIPVCGFKKVLPQGDSEEELQVLQWTGTAMEWDMQTGVGKEGNCTWLQNRNASK